MKNERNIWEGNMIQYIITGKLLRMDERYYYTTEGMFSKAWYRLMLGR